MQEGVTATDLVLVIVQMLREKGVVGKFVEFMALAYLTYPWPIGRPSPIWPLNMAPRADSSPLIQRRCAIWNLQAEKKSQTAEAYAKAQGMWRDDETPDPVFTSTLELDMGTVVPSISGPKRPQDRVLLSAAHSDFADHLAADLVVNPTARATTAC